MVFKIVFQSENSLQMIGCLAASLIGFFLGAPWTSGFTFALGLVYLADCVGEHWPKWVNRPFGK